MWRASIDHEHYRRVDGSWLFSGKRSQPLMNVPFDEGWARWWLKQTQAQQEPHQRARHVGSMRMSTQHITQDPEFFGMHPQPDQVWIDR